MRVINTEKIPIKLWLDDIEPDTLQQAKNLANLPFAFKHIAIMSDAHLGYGMPIGGVLATKGVVIPNAVGVDIGCGMSAVKTSIKNIDQSALKKIIGRIRRVIPMGFNRHREKQKGMPPLKFSAVAPVIRQQWEKAQLQIGTLGGGNHFVDILRDTDRHIWIMVHSGSRNLGFTIANHYNRLAIKVNKSLPIKVPRSWDLAYLPLDSQEGQQYLRSMQYCIDFALANRKLMIERIQHIFENEVGKINFDNIINIAHNYANPETHFDQQVMVHRKGATQANKDQIGIIPGSQGSPSYIVKGKGNPDSFMSCAHGAGRKMSRTQAKKTLDLNKEIESLNKMGIIHALRNRGDLDEAPGSYKSIDQVMAQQTDLVEVMVKLTPIAVIKS